jgi:excinuclease UvrABC ATPase subunit
MADLSDRIADVRRKAVAYRDVNATSSAYTRVWADLYNAMSADLIIQMADRIEELEKEREEAVLVREYAHRVTAAAARNKALEEAAAKVRLECAACGGTGHASEDAECEYCGRPMRAILALKSKEPTP